MSFCSAGEGQSQAFNPKLFDFSLLHHHALLPQKMLPCTLEWLLEENKGADMLKKWMCRIGSRKIFIQNKNSLILNGVTLQPLINVILQNNFFFQVILKPCQNQRELSSLGIESKVAEQEETKTSQSVFPLFFPQGNTKQHFYVIRSTAAPNRITLKS